jgi:hypothetical protein
MKLRGWSDAEIKLAIGLVQPILLATLFVDFVFLRAPSDFNSIKQDLNEDGTLRSEVIAWKDTRIKTVATAKRYVLY